MYRGLGQDDSGDSLSLNIPSTTLTLPTLPAGYDSTATFTGLPLWIEVSVGAIVGYLIYDAISGLGARVKKGVKAARRG